MDRKVRQVAPRPTWQLRKRWTFDVQSSNRKVRTRSCRSGTKTHHRPSTIRLKNEEDEGKYYPDNASCVTNPYQFLQEDFDSNDWEVVSDSPKTMSFQEMLETLRDGKKVKRLAFAECISRRRIKYVVLKEKEFHTVYNDQLTSTLTLTLDDLDATDWVEVNEE